MVDCCMTEFLYFLQCTARRQRPVEDWCKFVNGLAFHLRMVNCKCSNPPNRSTYRRLFSMAKEKEKLDKNHVFLFLSYFLSFVSSKNWTDISKNASQIIVIRELNINITQKERRRLISDHRQVNYIREIFFPKLEVRWNLQWKIMIFESKFPKKKKGSNERGKIRALRWAYMVGN